MLTIVKTILNGVVIMRCVSFCTASSYKLNEMAEFFKNKQYRAKLFRNVLYVHRVDSHGEIFFFQHGCFVMWGLYKTAEKTLLNIVKDFSLESLEKVEKDQFIVRLGKQTQIAPHARFNADIITLDIADADNVQIKLAISYGLAQSVKLEAFEESIAKTVADNSHIPNELAAKGRISLSRRAISKRIGEIFIERSSVNLKSDYSDIPEYFWRYSNLESYYVMTEKYLDIPKRVNALNHKLDVLHETFDVLNNQLQHRYSSMLEFVIILLIFIEIILNLIDKL